MFLILVTKKKSRIIGTTDITAVIACGIALLKSHTEGILDTQSSEANYMYAKELLKIIIARTMEIRDVALKKLGSLKNCMKKTYYGNKTLFEIQSEDQAAAKTIRIFCGEIYYSRWATERFSKENTKNKTYSYAFKRACYPVSYTRKKTRIGAFLTAVKHLFLIWIRRNISKQFTRLKK